jgi:signal peptide peptidase SppA
MTEERPAIVVEKDEKQPLRMIAAFAADIWNKLPWSAPKIAVISLKGIIAARPGAINLETYKGPIDRAFAVAKKTKHIILAIESPGGSAAQSDLIGQYIRRKADEDIVEIFSVIGDVGASGGYWLACAGDRIYANRLSIVGSIGVITGGFGLDRFIARYDIERRLFTAGENKARLESFSALRPQDEAFIHDLLDEAHGMFKDWVRERRGARLTTDEGAIFDGGFMSGERALGLGLIDGLKDVDSLVKELAGKRGRAVIFKPKQQRNLLRLITRTAIEMTLDIAEERTNTITLK